MESLRLGLAWTVILIFGGSPLLAVDLADLRATPMPPVSAVDEVIQRADRPREQQLSPQAPSRGIVRMSGQPNGLNNELFSAPKRTIDGGKAPVGPDALNPLAPPKIWSGGIEIGITGSEGNARVFNFRTGFEIIRDTADNLFTANGNYGLNTQNGLTTQHRAILNARDEILFGGSPWSIFSALQVEYDEFRAFDFRVGIYGGVSYAFINTERTKFKGRLGAGAVREIGGGEVADRWVPEGLIGFDFEHKFSDRQSLTASMDIFPSLANAGQFRLRSRIAYEIVIDPELGMVLRLGAQNRYDSNPGPAKRNDIDYFTTLLLRF